jgi:hypothetical protein
MALTLFSLLSVGYHGKSTIEGGELGKFTVFRVDN